MKLFRYEGYKITISEEAFALTPFKKIWNRDKTVSKDKAIADLSYIYFMVDPRSDYQYLVDPEERSNSIKEGEGLPKDWKPDKLITEAMEMYASFKPASALLLEDTRFMVDKFRRRLREVADSEEIGIKELKEIGMLIKQLPSIVKDLDEAEKAVAKEMNQSDKVRGSQEKSMYEDL